MVTENSCVFTIKKDCKWYHEFEFEEHPYCTYYDGVLGSCGKNCKRYVSKETKQEG